jgi:hypothetical protein
MNNNKVEIKEAKEWFLEMAAVDDDMDGTLDHKLFKREKNWVRTASDKEVIDRVNKEFDGGWEGFLLVSFGPKA